METQTNNNFSDQSGSPRVPPPPSLEINIRTMENDLKALSESGGELKNAGAQMKIASSPEMSERDSPGIVGYSGPEKPIFETAPSILPRNSEPSSQKVPAGESSKKIFIAVIALIWLIGLALLGYFVIWPMFLAK